MSTLEEFNAYIFKHQLFNADDHVLLAVSGGKDSVLMAQLFKLAGYQFSIAHCNFNLRADEAQRDETFVKLLAEEMNVPFHVAHFNTRAFAQTHKISIQMAARELRFTWFEELAKTHHCKYIALAHHQNDSIETLLLNLVRGTGIGGLHGILPKRGQLIRPLLFLSRKQIDDFVDEQHFSYVEDSSNESTKYARNKLRLQVVPHLREINPNLEETFKQNIHRFAQTEELLNKVVTETRDRLLKAKNDAFYISIEEVEKLDPQQLLLFELLRPYHFVEHVLNEVLYSLHKQSGTSFFSHSHRLTIDRGQLIISKIEDGLNRVYTLHSPGEISIDYQKRIHLHYVNNVNFRADQQLAYVDADLLIFPLTVRYKQEGDVFKPLGMKGFKKLSNFFIDEKISIPKKEKTPLLINGNGEIIWVAGMRQDERYKVGITTKKVAIFELLNQ